ERIVSRNIDPELPIAKVMSSPVITLPESAMLFEALMMMREQDVNHICIENSDGSISEAVNIKEIAYAKYQTHTLLIQRIKIADSYEELTDIFNSIPVLLRMLIKSGAKTDVITRINSNFSDEIALRIMDMVIYDMEKPPVDFAFITLGSVGRGEQTFLTDQDNAIIYDDEELEKEDEVKAYFLKLGETLNLKLHEVGYNYCKGEIMAKNPKWCMSVSDWKKQFRKWIVNSNPQDLLEVNIFFDIRDSGRNIELTKILRDYIYQLVKDEMLFFYHLAENVLSIKPPISFFGNFIVESTKENKSVFDIKKVIMLITSIARLYALKNNVKETNTLRRLKKLNTIGVLTDNQYSMLSKNLNYLMLMRINHQLEAINKHKDPNNLINPKHLTDLERTSLKKIFSQLSDFHNKISLDFKGSIK
ncbi:CBS domain-containing protein, partial [Candidatus Methanophagaceae archaeon]